MDHIAYHDFLQVNMCHEGIQADAGYFPFPQW